MADATQRPAPAAMPPDPVTGIVPLPPVAPDYSRVENPCAALPVAEAAPAPRLSDLPDWGYLIQEVRYLYTETPAGGSDLIRRHLRQVSEHLGKAVRADPPVVPGVPQVKPVTRHFGRALDRGEGTVMASPIRALAKLAGQLFWQFGYDRMPKALEQKYAYAELLGPRGPVLYDDVIIGLVLFAPHTVYPPHAHTGITESYICLSGAVSENHAGVYLPGSLILNQPQTQHRITSQEHEPALLLYAWAGARADLAGQKMAFSRQGRRERKP